MIRILFIVAAMALSSCATSTFTRNPDGRSPDRVAFDLLYSVAPKLRREHLELVNNVEVSIPRSGSWRQGGDVHADFRYSNDPEVDTRLLALRRKVPGDGTSKISLELCRARKYFSPFEGGGGQERWAIYDRKPYAQSH